MVWLHVRNWIGLSTVSLSIARKLHTILFNGGNASKFTLCFQSNLVCLCLGDMEGL